jgi:hypothetical protein
VGKTMPYITNDWEWLIPPIKMVIGGFITINMTNTTVDRRNPAGWQMVYHTIIHKVSKESQKLPTGLIMS